MTLFFFITDFDGMEVHTKTQFNRPEMLMPKHEESDTALQGPTVSEFVSLD